LYKAPKFFKSIFINYKIKLTFMSDP